METINNLLILGIGNVLQKDDGLGVYASTYLRENYTFDNVDIINGGVEGIHLLNLFTAYKHIIILDSVTLDDAAGTIYAIPTEELTGYGLNSGGAHEVGVIQCLDILELKGTVLPQSILIGIVPDEVSFDIALSATIEAKFQDYLGVVLQYLDKHNVGYAKKHDLKSLKSIIEKAKDPSGALRS